jgi:hypothetical protein
MEMNVSRLSSLGLSAGMAAVMLPTAAIVLESTLTVGYRALTRCVPERPNSDRRLGQWPPWGLVRVVRSPAVGIGWSGTTFTGDRYKVPT